MKRTLDHDNLIGWRRRDQDLALSLEEGDPVVITISSNGHDASAKILTSFSETVTIPKNFQCYLSDNLNTVMYLTIPIVLLIFNHLINNSKIQFKYNSVHVLFYLF